LPPTPKLDRERARIVLERIDQILRWEQSVDRERDAHFIDLGRYLCEVRSGQYWRLERLKSFDDFLAKRFPQSRRKAYYLMAIQEHLPPPMRKQLKLVGWSKATELVKVARSEGKRFESAVWVHKAQTLPKEQFRQEVERHLNGSSEPGEMIYFKLWRSQLPVIEQAIETAARMLGSDRSRGYCLEMICADFLAGAHLQEDGDRELLYLGFMRLYQMLPPELQRRFAQESERAA
jgi:hypothetical protein